MTKIQIDLDEDEDLIVSLFKLKNKLTNKTEAIKEMIKCFDIEFDIRLKRTKPKWK